MYFIPRVWTQNPAPGAGRPGRAQSSQTPEFGYGPLIESGITQIPQKPQKFHKNDKDSNLITQMILK